MDNDIDINNLELNQEWLFWPTLLSIIFNFSVYYFLQESESDVDSELVHDQHQEQYNIN